MYSVKSTVTYISVHGESSSWSLSECTCCGQVAISDVSVVGASVLRPMCCAGCLVLLQKIVQKSFASLCAGVCARNLYRVSQSASVGSIHNIYV